MHQTDALDVRRLMRREASSFFKDGEMRLKPVRGIIQVGTNQTEAAHGGPGLFLAVLVDRRAER
jgi:hypothetical protein